jgi:Tol biopolymer transport system component
MKPGVTLGPYEILEQLGAGGMGEVWLANDTRLGRKVAVKVLPAEFAGEAERLARFEQEARAAAALNHPHIAVVHDVGHQTDEAGATVHFMVQEYLEGQALSDLIGSKGALSVKRALDLATEIAEALAAAHGAGIVHRDLKPANVFVTKDGHAKVLDFGLAKLTEVAPMGPNSDTRSPTMLGTVAGQVMGTAGYMAPEQIEGESVDARADLFAFGCLLYEICTGQRAFAGKNVLDTLHRIANSEPQPLAEISDQLPVDLQRIVRKCLAKEPSARYQTAGDLTVDLKGLSSEVERGTALPLSAASSILPAGSVTGAGSTGVPRARSWALGGVGAALGVLLGAVAMGWLSASPPPEVSRFEMSVPEGLRLDTGLAVSPDGREVVFAAGSSESPVGLYRRRLDDLTVSFIPGSDGGKLPSFSPDGRWILFDQRPGRGLAKIPAEGGEPLVLADYGGPIYSSWVDDEWVLFENNGVIYRISAAGGEAQVVIDEGGEPRYDFPHALPGGRHALVAIRTGPAWSVAALDLETAEVTSLMPDAVDPGYLDTGHLTFVRESAVWAVAFDPKTLEISGSPFPLRGGVRTVGNKAQFAFSGSGLMVYVPGAEQQALGRISWISGNGEVLRQSAAAPGDIFSPRLSPDERYVALQIAGERETAVYTYDIRRDTFSLLRSNDETTGGRPIWSPDGRWVYYSASVDNDFDLYRAAADRSAAPERLLERPGLQFPLDVTPDGDALLFSDAGSLSGASDIWLLSLDSGETTPFIESPYRETQARLSPDGRWLAYRSDSAGDSEVYATAFPGPGPTQQVSSEGGSTPVWARDGSRLYFGRSPGLLFEAELLDNASLEFAAPVQVMEPPIIPNPLRGASFDVDAEGIFLTSDDRAGLPDLGNRWSLVVTTNWFEVVRERAPESR